MTEIKIGLLGYGTVGSAVDRLLTESETSIERVTGRKVRVGRALGPETRGRCRRQSQPAESER